jgi:hypothetical protein
MDAEKEAKTHTDRSEVNCISIITVHGNEKRFAAKSLYILPIQNTFRRNVIWLHEWKWFDRLVLFLILLNSLFLAMNDYAFRIPGG